MLHLLTSVDSRTSGVRSYKSVVTTTDQWSWDCFLRSHVSVAHWPRVSTSSSHWLWCSESLASSVVVSTVLIFTWLSLLVVSIFSVDNTSLVSCLQVRCFRWCSPALVSQQENQWRQIYLWFLKSEGVDHLLADHEHHWNYWTSCGNGWATNICETENKTSIVRMVFDSSWILVHALRSNPLRSLHDHPFPPPCSSLHILCSLWSVPDA